MKLLVLSPVFPDSPCDGDRLRLFHWLQHLSRRHAVTLACFADPDRPDDWDDAAWKGRLSLHRVPWGAGRRKVAALLRLAGDLPVSVTAEASSQMQDLVDSLIASGGFDAVLAYRLKMAPYALRFRGPRFLDYTDSLTRYAERRAAALQLQGRHLAKAWWQRQSRQLSAFEAWCAGQFQAGFFNAGQDRDAVAAMAPARAAHLFTAANGAPDLAPLKRRQGSDLVFVGNLAYAPNAEAVLWFAAQVLPRIRAHRPQARFLVVGGGAGPAIQALASQKGVSLLGYQAETAPLLAAAAVAVCPVFSGAGRQNKVLDALSAGLPCVASPLAAAGAEIQPGREALVADSPQAFAQAVLRCLAKPVLGQGMAKAGQALIKKRYQWRTNALGLEHAMTQAMRSPLW